MEERFQLTDLIDLDVLRGLAESLWRSSGLPTKVIDPAGRVLVSAGNQDLCALFHRQHPVTLQRCLESDTEIDELLRAGNGGRLEARCRNGLNHIGLPIVIAGRHLATIFLSQFLYDPPDEEAFRRRAQELGLDAERYIAATRKIPVLDRARVREVVPFYQMLVRLLTEMGAREVELLDSRGRLQQSETQFRTLFEGANDALFMLAPGGRILKVNEVAAARLLYDRSELEGKHLTEIDYTPHAASTGTILEILRETGQAVFETVHVASDDSRIPVEVNARTMQIDGEEVVLAIARDITERKRQEEALLYRERIESMVAAISTRLMEEGPAGLDGAVDRALREIGEFAGVDRSYVFQFSETGDRLSNSHEWCAAGISCEKEKLQNVPLREVFWIAARILAGQTVHIPRVANLEAAGEREHLASQAIRSLLAVPVVSAGRIAGLIGFDAVRAEKTWDERDITLLRTVGEIIGSAIERRRAEEAIEYRARLDQLIAEISARMVNLEPEAVDEAIDAALRDLGNFVRVDRCYLFQFSDDGRSMANTHEWCARGILPFRDDLHEITVDALPWFAARIRRREPVYVPDVTQLGSDAAAERKEWQREGIHSLLCVPMVLENRLLGFIGFDAVCQPKRWPEEIILLLRVVGECFANALERRRTDRIRREREALLQTIMDSFPFDCWVMSPQGSYLLQNPASRRHWGEAIGKRPEDLDLPPEVLADWQVNNRRALAGEVVQGEGTYRQNGVERHVHRVLAPIHDREHVRGIVGVNIDITERKEAEAALRRALQLAQEAQARIAAMLRCLPAGVLFTDPEERIAQANAPARDILGLPEASWQARPLAGLVAPVLHEQIRTVLAGNDGTAVAEWEVSDGNGGRRMIQARTDRVVDGAGQTTGAITLLQDITREREIDRMKNEFISTAAHELRTPLASVMGYTELLLNQARLGTFSAEEQRGFLEEVYARADDLAGIVDDLLNLSRVESGQLVRLRPSREELTPLLTETVADFRHLHPDYHFDLELTDDLPPLCIDRGKIRQVLENLLGNAVKFSPRGTTVRVEGTCATGEIGIAVCDQGRGMTAEQLAHVFDKFYRGDTSDTAAGGLGLGMAIVKNIVEAHGGKIRVDSAPGEGTAVRFSLPLQQL